MNERFFINGVEVTKEDDADFYKKAAKIDGIPQPLASDTTNWPIWVKAFKLAAKPGDRGIGDVVARLIGDENSQAFNAWHLKTFGKPCGCEKRKAHWNRLYPL